ESVRLVLTFVATVPDASCSVSVTRPPCVPEKKMTGSTGRMHGEMPVINPPMKPIAMSVVISVLRSLGRFGHRCETTSLIGNECVRRGGPALSRTASSHGAHSWSVLHTGLRRRHQHVSIRYTVALAVLTPPHTTPALLT